MPGRRTVPLSLALVLRNAAEAEATATGGARRPAFRMTRFLLAGAIQNGFSNTSLAAVTGMSDESVRTRGGNHGPVSVVAFAMLAEIPDDTIDRWEQQQILGTATVDYEGNRAHPASALIRALLSEVGADGEPSPVAS
jgi:hypothetical protein